MDVNDEFEVIVAGMGIDRKPAFVTCAIPWLRED